MKLDHIMYATADLDTGISDVLALTGVRASPGGSHPGNGTRNALMSLGTDQYLEIIAPDPAQELAGTLGEEIARYTTGGIRTWAVATTSGFAGLQAALDVAGFGHRFVDMDRTRPDGVRLAWRLLFVTGHPFGRFMPFFIDWLGSPHPATDGPGACRLTAFSVELQDGHEALRAFLQPLCPDVEVIGGPDAMRAVIESPNGRVMLH